MKQRKARGWAHIVLMCLLLAAFVVLSVGSGCAEEYAELTVTREAEAVPSALSADELAEGYIHKAFYPPRTLFRKAPGGTARANLTGHAASIYDALYPLIAEVAAGQRASTSFILPGIYNQQTLYPQDLGLDAFFQDGSFSLTYEAVDALNGLVCTDVDAAIDALRRDCPYEMYWYTVDAGWSRGCVNMRSDGTNIQWSGDVSVDIPVAPEYSGGNYIFDTSWGQSVADAVENAHEIATRCSGMTDAEKLYAYKEEICSLVSYNEEASMGAVQYGNPWQLVWVFDGDPTTNVVCEGYSKAFQYLCDISSFDSDITVLSVYGHGHMWNLVNMDDGLNYLADLTNCDDGSIGYPDELFLAGYLSGTARGGYYFYTDRFPLAYQYADDMFQQFTEEQLTVASHPYSPAAVDPVPEDEALSVAEDTIVTGAQTIRRGEDYPFTVMFPGAVSDSFLQRHSLIRVSYYYGNAAVDSTVFPLYSASWTWEDFAFTDSHTLHVSETLAHNLAAGQYTAVIEILRDNSQTTAYQATLNFEVTEAEIPAAPEIVFDKQAYNPGEPVTGTIVGTSPDALVLEAHIRTAFLGTWHYTTMNGHITLDGNRFTCDSFDAGEWGIYAQARYGQTWSEIGNEQVFCVGVSSQTAAEDNLIAENASVSVPASIREGEDLPVSVTYPAAVKDANLRRNGYVQVCYYPESGNYQAVSGKEYFRLYEDTDKVITFPTRNSAILLGSLARGLAPGNYKVTVGISPDRPGSPLYRQEMYFSVLPNTLPQAPQIVFDKEHYSVNEQVTGYVYGDLPDQMELAVVGAGRGTVEKTYATALNTVVMDGGAFTCRSLGLAVGEWRFIVSAQYDGVWSETAEHTVVIDDSTVSAEEKATALSASVTASSIVAKGEDIAVRMVFPQGLSDTYKARYRALRCELTDASSSCVGSFAGTLWTQSGSAAEQNVFTVTESDEGTVIEWALAYQSWPAGEYVLAVGSADPETGLPLFVRRCAVTVLSGDIPAAPTITLSANEFYYSESVTCEGISGSVDAPDADRIQLTYQDAAVYADVVNGQFVFPQWLGCGTWEIQARVRIGGVWSERQTLTVRIAAFAGDIQLSFSQAPLACTALPISVVIPGAEQYEWTLTANGGTIGSGQAQLTNGEDTLELFFQGEQDACLLVKAYIGGVVCLKTLDIHVQSNGWPEIDPLRLYNYGMPTFMQPFMLSWDAVEGAQYRVSWCTSMGDVSSGVLSDTEYTFSPQDDWRMTVLDDSHYIRLDILIPGYNAVALSFPNFSLDLTEDSRVRVSADRQRVTLGGRERVSVAVQAQGADEIRLFCLHYDANGNPAYTVYDPVNAASAVMIYSEEDYRSTHLSEGTLRFYAAARYGQSWSGISNTVTVSVAEPEDNVMTAPDLTLPASLTAIRDEAFRGISARRVLLPDNVAEIGDYAFADCASLEQIYIPASVRQIGAHAFDNTPVSLKIFGAENSFAKEYAGLHGIDFVTVP